MKYLVELLNFDGEWILYHTSDTYFGAVAAECELYRHGYTTSEVRINQNNP